MAGVVQNSSRYEYWYRTVVWWDLFGGNWGLLGLLGLFTTWYHHVPPRTSTYRARCKCRTRIRICTSICIKGSLLVLFATNELILSLMSDDTRPA